MRDLEMKLHAVIAPRLVGDGGHRRVLGLRDGFEAFRQARDAIAMTHPHRIFVAALPYAVEQRAWEKNFDIGAAEFPVKPGLDLAAELFGQKLLAITDGQHGDAGIENLARRARRSGFGDGTRPAREDHRLGPDLREGLLRALKRRDLAIDAGLAHAPRDQLRHLRAEIDDQRLVMAVGDFVMEVGGHRLFSVKACACREGRLRP